MKKYIFSALCVITLLTGCSFHLQGEKALPKPLHRLYLQVKDPYSYFARHLKEALQISNIVLTVSPEQAETILSITKDTSSQELLSVSGTQQTRQYSLVVTIEFEITNTAGVVLVGPETLTERRTITVQSNQILGSSNEANLFYQQMHRSLTYALINRLASQQVASALYLRPSRK
ncbi:MAG TPA: LPS assembly lipoprotein LptE [Gammaproteobacteria bacterium]|nr:LPS assembly lipoprotein LptE [Gammaproteobacteria bacterium]